MGKIIVKRKKSIFGCAIPFKVFIDDVEVGKLTNGKEVEKEVELSTHKVVIKTIEKATMQEITLSDDKDTVIITVGAQMGFFVAHVKILSIE